MKFLCKGNAYNILVWAASDLEATGPTLEQVIDIQDYRLVPVANALGLEMIGTVEQVPDASAILQKAEAGDTVFLVPALEADSIHQKAAVEVAKLIEVHHPTSDKLPACEICGKQVATRRMKVCSEECKTERNRRYAREYARTHKPVAAPVTAVEEAGDESEAPL